MTIHSHVHRIALVAVLAFASLTAAAQDSGLPQPEEAYGMDDPAAVAPKRIDANDNLGRQTLEQILQYDPENVNARIQNAELLIARGMRQRGLDEYVYALRLAESDPLKLRTVYWNYGWALFRVGEARGAITQWQQAERMHGGQPIWVPTTYAVGLWVAGEKELALQFYKAAVRSNPRRWGEASGLKESTANWGANEKAAVDAVYAAWREGVGAGR
jgi:tetratricopeptide (TPR) repeat protein